MREHKYRVWDGKVMHSGDEYVGGWTSQWPLNEVLTPYAEEVFLQYTGLKDCKRTDEYPDGQEIYEGDIIRTARIAALEKGGVIEWADNGFWIVINQEVWMPTEEYREVIGNIYEHPELLKGTT